MLRSTSVETQINMTSSGRMGIIESLFLIERFSECGISLVNGIHQSRKVEMELTISKPVLSGLVKTFDQAQQKYNRKLESLAEDEVSEDALHYFVTAHNRLRQCTDPSGTFFPEFLIKDIQRRIDSIVSDAPGLEDLVSVQELDWLVDVVGNMQKLRDVVVAKHLCSQAGCEALVPISLGAWLNLHIDLETMAMVAENITCSACLEHICESES